MSWCFHLVIRDFLLKHTLSQKIPSECFSAMQYYKYRLMPWSGETFNSIHRMERLFQQYVVDMYAKIEFSRLQFLRFSQSQLCADLYQGLADAVLSSDGLLLGKKLFFLHLLQVVQDTSINCTKMQWVLFTSLENQISLKHLHVIQNNKKLQMLSYLAKLQKNVKILLQESSSWSWNPFCMTSFMVQNL